MVIQWDGKDGTKKEMEELSRLSRFSPNAKLIYEDGLLYMINKDRTHIFKNKIMLNEYLIINEYREVYIFNEYELRDYKIKDEKLIIMDNPNIY